MLEEQGYFVFYVSIISFEYYFDGGKYRYFQLPVFRNYSFDHLIEF